MPSVSLRPPDGAVPELARADAAPVAPPGPRGHLTFADGTTAQLDPAQARELADIAATLTARDGVKH